MLDSNEIRRKRRSRSLESIRRGSRENEGALHFAVSLRISRPETIAALRRCRVGRDRRIHVGQRLAQCSNS